MDIFTDLFSSSSALSGGGGSGGSLRATWAYQDFLAGSILSTSVTITANSNGVAGLFLPANIISGSAAIFRQDGESYAYTGTTKLFSSKVQVNSQTLDSITLSGVPNASWGTLRIWYQIRATSIPFGYTNPPLTVSSKVSGELGEIFIPDTDIGVTVQAYSPRLTDIAALTPISGNFMIGNGSTWASNPISGDITINSSGVAAIGANKVTNSQFRQSAALSVVGNSTNATTNIADISAASDFQVLRRSGTSIGFGAINLASTNAVSGLLSPTSGGTGIANNAASTLTFSGNFGTTFTVTGTTSLTLPTSGTLATVGGTVASITGTANQILANGLLTAQTGAVTLSLPQNIATTSSPTFANITATSTITCDTVVTGGNTTVNQIFSGAKSVNILLQSNKTSSVNSTQLGIWDTSFCAPVANVNLVTSLYSNQLVSVPSGITVATIAGFAASPNFSLTGTGTTTKYAAFLFDGGTTSPTQIVTNSYAAYFAEPLFGSSKHGIRNFGDLVSGTLGQFTIDRLGEVVSAADATFNSLATTLDVTAGNGLAVFGNATFDNNNIATGTAVEYGGVVPVSAASTSGVEYAHAFVLANDVTNIYCTVVSPGITPSSHTVTNVIANYIATGAVTGSGTITNGFGQVIDNPSFGTNKWSLWSKGRLAVGPNKEFLIGTTGAIESCTSITCAGNVSISSGELSVNQNNAFSNNGLIAEFYGTVPGRASGGSPWSVLTGMALYHNFSVQDNTTYATQIEVNPTFTIANATTISDCFGLYLRAGTGALTGTGNATRYTNLNVEEPSFGTTKYAAKFFGAFSVGTTGQFNISRLGVVSTADGTFLGVGNTPTVDIQAYRNSANAIIGIQRNGFSIFGMQNDSDNGMRLGVYSGSDISNQLYIQKTGGVIIGGATAATSSLLTPTSATQVSSRITLAGQEYVSAATTSTDGIALLCGLNRANLRGISFADSAKLTQNASNAMLRLNIRTDIGPMTQLDSITTDSSIGLPLSINPKGGNIALFSETTNFGSGAGVMFMANATTIPTTNPSGGFVKYAQAGAEKTRGSSGTITTNSPAHPHCPECGADFSHQWANPKYGGELTICKPCELDHLNNLRISMLYIAKGNIEGIQSMQSFLEKEANYFRWNIERIDEYKDVRIPLDVGADMAAMENSTIN